jgi:hypothetical protein
MDGFLGTAVFEGGCTEVAQRWLIKNTMTVTGGRLKMPEFSFAAQGEGGSAAGGRLILAGGILETGTGQIFTNGLNAEGDNRDPGSVKLSDGNWSFESGLIAFNDALYNLTYAQAAADSLGANTVDAGKGAGSAFAKEITFIGAGYVEPDPEPVPPVEPDPVPPATEPKPDEEHTGRGYRRRIEQKSRQQHCPWQCDHRYRHKYRQGFNCPARVLKTARTDPLIGSISGKTIDLGSYRPEYFRGVPRLLPLAGGPRKGPWSGRWKSVNFRVEGTGEGDPGC